MRDKNDNQLENGDIIDIHQTVNGQNLFLVLNISPLDIRYAHDLNHKYEYDMADLLSCSNLTGEVDYEIVSNIYKLLFNL